MLPREHGAYSQMALPIVTSSFVAGVTLASTFTAVAVFFGFLAHEPILVLLGRRGVRVQTAVARRAWKLVAAYSIAMVGSAVIAVLASPSSARWAFVLPAIPAVVVGAGLLAKREKSAPAELAVAVAFSLAAAPMCVVAGAALSIAISIGVVFATVFVAGTLAVRTVILKVRAGGRPKAVRNTRLGLVVIVVAALAGFGCAAIGGVISVAPLVAVGPGLIAAMSLAFRSDTPTLKMVGWTLMSTSAAAAVILIAAL